MQKRKGLIQKKIAMECDADVRGYYYCVSITDNTNPILLPLVFCTCNLTQRKSPHGALCYQSNTFAQINFSDICITYFLFINPSNTQHIIFNIPLQQLCCSHFATLY